LHYFLLLLSFDNQVLGYICMLSHYMYGLRNFRLFLWHTSAVLLGSLNDTNFNLLLDLRLA
ncbi:hypothetical protein L9F63_024980, partial [Diploptera punctata]